MSVFVFMIVSLLFPSILLIQADLLKVESAVKLTRPKPRQKKEPKINKEEGSPPPESFVGEFVIIILSSFLFDNRY